MEKMFFTIKGTHCSSCEVLIERRLKAVQGVEEVTVNHMTGKTELYYNNAKPSLQQLNEVIKADGYSIATPEAIPSHHSEQTETTLKHHEQSQENEPTPKNDYIELASIFVILIGVYFLLKEFNILPQNFGVSDNMGYGVIFIIGLIAAMSTCLAVSGGLLLSIAAKHNEQHPNLTGYQKFKPHVYFNIGRIAGYTIFGGLIGALGSILTLSSSMNGILTVLASLIMIILGLQLLHLFPSLGWLQPKLPKLFAHKVYAKDTNHKAAPFFFGAATFFFPCGFTQALQLYVLVKGSFAVGALTMLFFSLGTLPSLASISAISSFAKGSFKTYFTKFAAVAVILLGFSSIGSGFVLLDVAGAAVPTAPTANPTIATVPITSTGSQLAVMAVRGLDYFPDSFTIKKGVPVEWQIDGSGAQGCAQIISVPKLGIIQRLQRNTPTTIRFTPEETGAIRFSCSMGMAGPGVFIVV